MQEGKDVVEHIHCSTTFDYHMYRATLTKNFLNLICENINTCLFYHGEPPVEPPLNEVSFRFILPIVHKNKTSLF